jgi:tetratricopeptide (TPR) repeat protein
MTLISIREQAPIIDGFNAILTLEQVGEFPLVMHHPFSPKQEARLAWYFEEHIRYPFVKQVIAREAAASIVAYGEALFTQLFSNPRAYAAYWNSLQQGVNTLHFEIVGSPAFHQLHWEALKDPDLPQPFVLQSTMVRRNIIPRPLQASVRPSPTIRLLVVTARPFGRQDVGYRTISRPLIEELRQANLHVQVEIVRPGTYKALDYHLREAINQHGAGYYHVIHFDVHGALLTHDQFQQGGQSNRYLFQARYGRDDITPFEGSRAFLFLESEHDDRADLVEAEELATLLLRYQIPIAILNACQSGKQVGSSETSLGSQLMRAGIQVVLAMGYSVSVSAARVMMRTLYKELFARHDLATAIRQARLELANAKGRLAAFNQQIDLEDWLLPVVYQHQPQQLSTRELTQEERAIFYSRQAVSYPDVQTTYGFFGRDLDILQIEKRLLTKRNIVLVQGMGGAGKTTLLRHLGFWWQTTGLVAQVYYFGYDERAWTRQQILVAIAGQLLDPVAYVRDFQPLPTLDAQQALLTHKLRAERHLLILDNLESIAGSHLAIQHTLPPEEQETLRRLLADLVGGRTLVLLGSRGSEAWLAKGTFEKNHYALPGLDPEAASALAERILKEHHASRYLDDKHLPLLITLLDGFPLALQVVLANLVRQTPQEVLAALQAGDVSLDQVRDSQQKTESILHCIEYSYSNLSPEAQRLLMCLGPFTSVIPLRRLKLYTEVLRQQAALAGLPFERWGEVIEEAKQWGLLSPHEFPGYLYVQPTLPYFLHSRLRAEEQAEMKRAVETAFRTLYDGVGGAFFSLLTSKEPEERQTGQILTGLEYENLSTALTLALAAQASILHLYGALSHYLDTTQEHQRGLELGQTVLSRLEQYSPELLAGQLGVEFAVVLGDIAERHRHLKKFAVAEASYQKALSLLLKSDYLDAQARKKLSASFYHNLGFVAQDQRDWAQAEQYYQQALQINSEFQDRSAQAITYHSLGIVAQGLRQWAQAEQYYQQALQINSEFNDHSAQAKTYHQLGTLAQDQRDWAQAEQYYQQALQINSEFQDRSAQADTYHNLGIVAQKLRQWAQAEQYYQQALQIYIEFNDHSAQAGTYYQLGIVAQKLRQWTRTRDYFLQALEIIVIQEDSYRRGIVLCSLARLWQASNDASLPVAVGAILHMTTDEVEGAFRKALTEEEHEAD